MRPTIYNIYAIFHSFIIIIITIYYAHIYYLTPLLLLPFYYFILFYFIAYIPPMRSIVYNPYAISPFSYYCYYYYYSLIRAFHISDSRWFFTEVWVTGKSPQVSRTLLSILAVLNNAVVWMVSTRPPTSKSSSPFSNPLVTVPNAPITIGIIVTCMFHSFFSSLARSRYLSFFSHSFCFILWSARTAKSTIFASFFFFVYYYYCYYYYTIPPIYITPTYLQHNIMSRDIPLGGGR